MQAPKYKVPHYGIRLVRERTLTLARQTAFAPEDVAAIAHRMIGYRPTEHLIVIALDGQNNVTGVSTVSIGGMHAAAVRPADVLRTVLAMHAHGFVLAHNHPSGDPTPSPEDVAATKAIANAASIVGAVMLDHVVVTRDPARYASAVNLRDIPNV